MKLKNRTVYCLKEKNEKSSQENEGRNKEGGRSGYRGRARGLRARGLRARRSGSGSGGDRSGHVRIRFVISNGEDDTGLRRHDSSVDTPLVSDKRDDHGTEETSGSGGIGTSHGVELVHDKHTTDITSPGSGDVKVRVALGDVPGLVGAAKRLLLLRDAVGAVVLRDVVLDADTLAAGTTDDGVARRAGGSAGEVGEQSVVVLSVLGVVAETSHDGLHVNSVEAVEEGSKIGVVGVVGVNNLGVDGHGESIDTRSSENTSETHELLGLEQNLTVLQEVGVEHGLGEVGRLEPVEVTAVVDVVVGVTDKSGSAADGVERDEEVVNKGLTALASGHVDVENSPLVANLLQNKSISSGNSHTSSLADFSDTFKLLVVLGEPSLVLVDNTGLARIVTASSSERLSASSEEGRKDHLGAIVAHEGSVGDLPSLLGISIKVDIKGRKKLLSRSKGQKTSKNQSKNQRTLHLVK